MSGFDYAYTCPEIDRQIASAKGTIESFLADMIDEASPLIPRKVREEIAADQAERLCRAIEDAFEATRATNVQMRDAADDQIRALESEIADLRQTIDQLEREAA